MRILILGGLGMVGHQMYLQLKREFLQINVCIRKSSSHAMKFGFFEPVHIIDNVDLLHSRTLDLALRNVNPDLVINCAGSTLTKTKTLLPSEIIELNSLFPRRLYEWCLNHSAFLIHLSNDEVFRGQEQPYYEDSHPDATSLYGKAKALGEIDGPSCLTLRGGFLGPELENPTELLSGLLTQPQEPIWASRHQYYCGVTTLYLAQFIGDLIRHELPLSGIYQIASQPISNYDLIHLIDQTFQLNLDLREKKDNDEVRNKILSNQKILKHWPRLSPKWSDMILSLRAAYEEEPFYTTTANPALAKAS